MTTPAETSRSGNVIPRLIIEATCTTCGSLEQHPDGLAVVDLAGGHTRTTGHVVVLNGTTDIAHCEENDLSRSSASAVVRPTPARFYVDLPTVDCIGNDDGAWLPIADYGSRREAISFAQRHFGADAEGRVCLIFG